MRRKANDPCPYCGKPLSHEFFVRREIARGAKISSALKLVDRKGRPRAVEYKNIWALRDMGFSIMKISEKLNIGRGSVQHALKLKKEALEKIK